MIIKKLKLISFGKFRDAEFNFAPITIFFGNNESGKSTLFDAIFDQLSSPPGNSSEGKRLSRRYGNERKAAIIQDYDKEVKISPEEFLNVYAIRAGSVNVDFSSGKGWTQKIKASIFSGGIDPGIIVGELEKLSSNGGNYKHVQELRRRKQELEEAEHSLKMLEERRKEILAAEKQVESSKKELNEIEKEIALLSEALKEAEKILEQQEVHRKLEDVRQTMERIVLYEQIAKKSAELEPYRHDLSETIKKLQSELDDKKRVVEQASRMVNQHKEQREDVALRTKERKAKCEIMRKKSILASELLSRIEKDAPKEIITYSVTWHPAGVASIAVAILIGIGMFLYLYPSLMAAIVLAAALVIASVVALVSRRKQEVRERPDTGRLCAALKDEWKIRTDEELVSSTIEGIQRELVRIQSEADALDKEIAELSNMEAILAKKVAEAEQALRKAQDEHDVARQKLDDLYRSFNITSSEEYAKRRTEYESVQRGLKELNEKLLGDIKRYSVNTIDELKAECLLRKSNFEKECVSERKSEVEINRLKSEITKKKEQLNNLQAKYVEIKSSIERGKGEVKGALGDLPQSIYENEKEIESHTREINRLLLDIEAAAIARDIFIEIAQDENIVFSELEKDIEKFLGGMLEGERTVEFKNFNQDSIALTDASGKMRSIEALSTGTKDAFVIAARFSFALRSWQHEHPGILVLDEPFHSLDKGRIARTVELILKFHRESAWQIVVFTKDEALAGALKGIAENVVMHTLSA